MTLLSIIYLHTLQVSTEFCPMLWVTLPISGGHKEKEEDPERSGIYLFICISLHTQTDEQDVINFLLTTEIIPLCLRIMESGSELSKTVATFILQKILLDETGLSYICQTFERFSHVATVLVSSV